jgi:hypothetical protein
VVGIAVVLVFGGGALALLGSSSSRPAPLTGRAKQIPGTSIRAEPAAPLLAHIARSGQPPADVTGALAVPAGSRYLGAKVLDRGVSQFDRSISVSVDAPASQVATFFEKALSAGHWISSSITSPSPGATEIISMRSASDGYQWRVGVTVTPVKVTVAPALAGSSDSAARALASIQLYQVADAS